MRYAQSPIAYKGNILSKPSTSFSGNVLKLVTGSAFAQGLGILVAPIVTRLFAPEAFGVAALFVSITAIISVIACLRYELSIMLPKTDEEAANLLAVSLCFVLIITAVTALIIFFAGDIIVRLLNSPELKKYLWLIPIAVFVSGVFLALNYWNSRTKHFGRLSIVRVVSSIGTQATNLGLGFAGYVSGGVLIGANIFGNFISTSLLGGQIWQDNRWLFKESICWKKMVAGFKRHKKFPIFDTWSALLNTISWQLPTLLLAFFFSPIIVGYYALGIRLVRFPMNLIGGAIAQVFFQRASEANISGNLDHVVENVFRTLVKFGLFPLLVLTVIGQDLFMVAFGNTWAEAGFYVQILAPFFFFVFISSPLSTLLRVLEKQQVALYLNIVIFVSRLFCLLIGGYIGNPRIALFLFSISGMLIYGWYSFYILNLSGISWHYGISLLLRNSSYGALGIMILLALKLFSISSIFFLILATLLLLIYEAIVVSKDPNIRIELMSLLPKLRPKVN